MKKRVISFLILASLAASAFAAASCGGGKDGGETSGSNADSVSDSSSNETTEAEPLGLPSGLNYDGYEFRILSRPDYFLDEVYSENNGDVLSEAVYKRNLKVQELLNIKFKYTESSSYYENDALNPILAGDDEYDAVGTHARYAFIYGYNNAALDWNKVDNVDLTKSWWNQDAVKNLSISGKLFQMDGAISYATISSSDCMLFNKKMLGDYSVDYPYEAVKSGKWTFDVFTENVKKFASDLNSDGEMKLEDDQFGYATNCYCGPVQVLYSAGCRVVTVDDSGYPQLTLYNERSVDVMDTYMSLLRSKDCFNPQGTMDHVKAFADGRIAYVDMTVNDIANHLRDAKTDFGVVPWPKWDETMDKYYTNVDAGHTMWIIPTTSKDSARTGAVLEAMAYYGKQLIIPAYYDITLQNKYLRDDNSVEMLDYIYEGAIDDIGYYNSTYFGGDLCNPGRDLALDDKLTFTNFYTKYETATKTLIEKSMEHYNSME